MDTRQQILDYVKSKSIKQNYLALNLGVSENHISQVLRGKRELYPSLLVRINDILNTDFTLENACTD